MLQQHGPIQEEAPGLGVPVLVPRETTERPEGIEAGVARLAGTRRPTIVAEAERLLRDPAARAAMIRRSSDAHRPGAAETAPRLTSWPIPPKLAERSLVGLEFAFSTTTASGPH